MKSDLAILGAGGHGRDIWSIARAMGSYRHIRLYDDNITDIDIAGRIRDANIEDRKVIGANWPLVKEAIYLQGIDYTAPPIIHPTVNRGQELVAEFGTVVGAHTCLGYRTILHHHVHVGAGVTITRAEVGFMSVIGPGANICGDVNIGKRVIIGAGATVSNLINIGDGAIIGAGAVVTKDIKPYTTVVGVPAKEIAKNVHYSV